MSEMTLEHKRNLSKAQPHRKEAPPEDELRKLYFEETLSQKAIGEHYGVSNTPVKRWFKKYGVEARSDAEQAKITQNGFEKGEEHPNWAGEKVSYSALHTWIRNELGTPSKCDYCGSTEREYYEWANKSGDYKRETDDWLRLCVPCHRKHDQ